MPVTSLTAANHTTIASVTNTTTAKHTTTVPVTNATSARHTTIASVTNTTFANHTTTVPVTNATSANHTTIASVTNTTFANHTTTVPVTNATSANHTTMAPVTNTTAAKHNITSTPTELPTLSPTVTFPVTGFYNVSLKNTLCIKMAIGIQLIVGTKSKNLYFNVPPSRTTVSGKCGNTTTWINLQFNYGFVNFTFRKDGKQYYISEIRVTLHSANNMDKTYHGIAKNMELFNAELGHSYKCKSKRVVHFSTDSLQILMVNTQVQAFNISGGTFGKGSQTVLPDEATLHLCVCWGNLLHSVLPVQPPLHRRDWGTALLSTSAPSATTDRIARLPPTSALLHIPIWICPYYHVAAKLGLEEQHLIYCLGSLQPLGMNIEFSNFW
ncbi:lysosome-associated membrane glycoprotein 3 isoform X2 [Hypanus sabinus]|nr:lysosome-associated membrane glycoprotein 3 isoform X2 [Hypanus sabinus]